MTKEIQDFFAGIFASFSNPPVGTLLVALTLSAALACRWLVADGKKYKYNPFSRKFAKLSLLFILNVTVVSTGLGFLAHIFADSFFGIVPIAGAIPAILIIDEMRAPPSTVENLDDWHENAGSPVGLRLALATLGIAATVRKLRGAVESYRENHELDWQMKLFIGGSNPLIFEEEISVREVIDPYRHFAMQMLQKAQREERHHPSRPAEVREMKMSFERIAESLSLIRQLTEEGNSPLRSFRRSRIRNNLHKLLMIEGCLNSGLPLRYWERDRYLDLSQELHAEALLRLIALVDKLHEWGYDSGGQAVTPYAIHPRITATN